MTVTLVARRADRLEHLATALGTSGATTVAVPADVTDPTAVNSALRQVHDALGRIDLVVNAAGVMLPNPITDGRADEWHRMMQVNLAGPLEVIRAFGPDLLAAAAAHGPADLVNISSIGAHTVFPHYAVYAATKAALSQLSANLRAEYGPHGFRVSNIEPGLTRTELSDHVDNPALTDQLADMIASIGALDAADTIGYVTSRRAHMNLRQLVVLPTLQV